MKPPVCPICKKAEWSHTCAGQTSALARSMRAMRVKASRKRAAKKKGQRRA